jgi:hypothetical protein
LVDVSSQNVFGATLGVTQWRSACGAFFHCHAPAIGFLDDPDDLELLVCDVSHSSSPQPADPPANIAVTHKADAIPVLPGRGPKRVL